MLRFERGHVMSENELRKLIGDYGFSIANLSSRLIDEGKFFEYRTTIRCRNQYEREIVTAICAVFRK